MKQADDATSGTGGGSGSSGGDPLVALTEIGRNLADLADDLRPECVPGHRVREITRALTDIERRARGMRLVLRKAAADTGDWRAKGHRSAADQVAKEEGISTGQAAREIEASGRLADLPGAREAAARGEISPEAAAVVAEGAAADRSSESSLVRTAKGGDLQATRRRAQEVIARADERSGERARRMYQRRGLRTWVTVDGEGHGHWNVPPEMHARFTAALAPYREAAFRAARAAGDRPTADQLMADALDMLMRDVLLDHEGGSENVPADVTDDHVPDDHVADGRVTDDRAPDPHHPDVPDARAHAAAPDAHAEAPAPGADANANANANADANANGSVAAHPAPRAPTPSTPPAADQRGRPARRSRRAPAQVHVLVDFDALRRGYATDGETCEIHGLGAIPVALARHLLTDAMLRLIVTGTDITTVSSHRRYVPEAVRRALFARDKGRCVVCGSDRYLELHHFGTDFAAGGATEYANLAHVCSREHALITHCGWTLHQTDDGWDLRPPGGAEGRDPP